MPYKHRFGPFAGEVYRVPMAYPLRWPGGPERCAAEALDVVTGLIHAQVGEPNVAAVLIEPIQGEGGFVVPPDGFLPGLADDAGGTAMSLPQRIPHGQIDGQRSLPDGEREHNQGNRAQSRGESQRAKPG